MALLHGEALAAFDARRRNLPAVPLSHRLFARIFRQWRAWPDQAPGERQGYSSQNPVLLECFAALDSAEAKAYD